MAAGILSGRVIGVQEVKKRLLFTLPDISRKRTKGTVRALGLQLQATVVTTNLAGVVLNKRSGRLQRSVNTKFNQPTANSFRSATGTKLVYGRAWELGFSTPAFDIVPKNREALAFNGVVVKSVHRPATTQAARPWLRPALQAMGPTIQRSLSEAMRGL